MFSRRLQYRQISNRVVQNLDRKKFCFRQLSSTVDSSKSSLLGPKDTSSEGWAWIPPRTMEHLEPEGTKKRYKLPINVGRLITAEELKTYLEQAGGQEVKVIQLPKPIVDITTFVIASFSSTRLIRKAAQAIQENLKARELFQVLGSKDIEGAKDEQWQAVDCKNVLVHLMLPETRKHLDLEGHWSAAQRPMISLSLDTPEFERKMDELLWKYPVPKGYGEEKSVDKKFHGFDTEVKSL